MKRKVKLSAYDSLCWYPLLVLMEVCLQLPPAFVIHWFSLSNDSLSRVDTGWAGVYHSSLTHPCPFTLVMGLIKFANFAKSCWLIYACTHASSKVARSNVVHIVHLLFVWIYTQYSEIEYKSSATWSKQRFGIGFLNQKLVIEFLDFDLFELEK